MEKHYRDIAGLDTNYAELKDFFREVWKHEDYNYIHIDRKENKNDGKYSFPKETNPNKVVEHLTETKFF